MYLLLKLRPQGRHNGGIYNHWSLEISRLDFDVLYQQFQVQIPWVVYNGNTDIANHNTLINNLRLRNNIIDAWVNHNNYAVYVAGRPPVFLVEYINNTFILDNILHLN